MIIVSSATGFIGRYLVDQLVKDGREVLAAGRSKSGEAYYQEIGIPFVRLDITEKRDFDKLPTNKGEAFVLLASLIPHSSGIKTAEDYMKVNGFGTYNALEFCRKNEIKKFVYTTSQFELESRWTHDNSIPLTEDSPLSINYTSDHTLYIISKVAAREYVRHFSEQYGMQGVILRLAGVHGRGGYPMAWKMFIDKAHKSEPIEIWGDNIARRDNIYIKDVVSALIAAIDSKSAIGLYNIASGEGVTLEDEVKAIVKTFSPQDNPSKLIYCPEKPGIAVGHIHDISKAERELGWTPKFSCEEMLIDYKKELEEYKGKDERWSS